MCWKGIAEEAAAESRKRTGAEQYRAVEKLLDELSASCAGAPEKLG